MWPVNSFQFVIPALAQQQQQQQQQQHYLKSTIIKQKLILKIDRQEDLLVANNIHMLIWQDNKHLLLIQFEPNCLQIKTSS
jgi:hypothetical protein